MIFVCKGGLGPCDAVTAGISPKVHLWGVEPGTGLFVARETQVLHVANWRCAVLHHGDSLLKFPQSPAHPAAPPKPRFATENMYIGRGF